MEQTQKSERCQHCNIKCGLLKVSPEVLRTLEDEFEKLSKSKSNSLLKKYLTKEIFDQNKHKVSSYGSNLLDCAQSGFANYDSSIGLYAPDPEAYAMFASLFNPIIQEYHIGFTPEDKHPKLNWGNLVELEDLDPSGDHIISTRVRCGRSIEGYPFNPLMTETHYREIETKMITIFDGFTDDFAGTYRSLIHMSKNEQHELIDSHYLFREGDKFLRSAGACRFWPLGRGIFLNEAKTFVVWVNEEDHLRIISMEPGGNLLVVYKRMIDGVQAIEKSVKFSRSSKLGFLTFCPTNLGTTLRASVHIKIPKLAANMDRLESVARRYHLQIRGTRGEHTETEGGIYDISNKRRLGITEAEAIQEMHEGISEIIRMEESLE